MELIINLIKPHAKQAAFMRSTAKRRVIVAGRRGGKTTAAATLAVEAMPFGAAFTRIVSGQILYKAAVTVLSLPLIYTVEDKPIQEAAITNGRD